MDYSALQVWVDLVQLLTTGAVAVYVGVLARTRYNARRLREHEDAVDGRLDKAEQSLVRLDERLAHAADVRVGVQQMTKEVSRLRGEIDGVKASLDRVNDYLLSHPRA